MCLFRWELLKITLAGKLRCTLCLRKTPSIPPFLPQKKKLLLEFSRAKDEEMAVENRLKLLLLSLFPSQPIFSSKGRVFAILIPSLPLSLHILRFWNDGIKRQAWESLWKVESPARFSIISKEMNYKAPFTLNVNLCLSQITKNKWFIL